MRNKNKKIATQKLFKNKINRSGELKITFTEHKLYGLIDLKCNYSNGARKW